MYTAEYYKPAIGVRTLRSCQPGQATRLVLLSRFSTDAASEHPHALRFPINTMSSSVAPSTRGSQQSLHQGRITQPQRRPLAGRAGRCVVSNACSRGLSSRQTSASRQQLLPQHCLCRGVGLSAVHAVSGRRQGLRTCNENGVVCAASSVSTLDAPSAEDASPLLATERARRLATLLELKKLYRNCIRAEYLVKQPSPVYTQPPSLGTAAATAAAAEAASSSVEGVASAAPTAAELAAAEEDAEKRAAALELVAEMQLTAEQLKTSARSLQPGFGIEFAEPSSTRPSQQQLEEMEERVRSLARQYSSQLKERAAAELPCLPYESEAQAQLAVDMRNSRYKPAAAAEDSTLGATSTPSSGSGSPADAGSPSSTSSISTGRGMERLNSFPDRLNAAEKVAEKFVAKRIKPALQRAQEKEFLEVVQESGRYLRGFWDRLNGSGGASAGVLPASLPLPASQKDQLEEVIIDLRLEIESLEKRLTGASKARERQLRKTAAAKRASLASQLKVMDAEVIMLSRLVAVRTLQLELVYVYRSLEEEALDIGAGELARKGALAREGSTVELALLVAEYGLLEKQLRQVADDLAETFKAVAAGGGHDPLHGGGTGAEGLAALGGLALVDDELLDVLAAEIPDLRNRVGVNDGQVYGSSNPLDPTKVRMSIKDSSDKLMEGINFLLRGLRLLGSDVGNAGRLFSKAALGGRLKPREVSALRRTARDLLTFIPFIIILVIPMTPLGHVLVFGFIQRYFPGFFPSQFTSQRQDIMVRYEDLKQQLTVAQLQAEREADEQELKRAEAAVARLTAPAAAASASSSSSSGSSIKTAATPSKASSSSSSTGSSVQGSPVSHPLDLDEVEGGAGVSTGGGSVPAQGAARSSVTSPSSATATTSSSRGGAQEDDEDDGPAAQKLKALKEQLQEARESVHTGVSDEEEDVQLEQQQQQQVTGATATGQRH